MKLILFYLFIKSNHIYQTSKISEGCINLDKNWQDIEEQYFNSSKQIIYIDDFLSNEAIKELREFCLVIQNLEYRISRINILEHFQIKVLSVQYICKLPLN